MKDEELLEAFERVERFIDYQYRKSHGNLFLLVGSYLFFIIIFSGYGSEISDTLHVPISVLSIGLFISFIVLSLLFGERGFRLAHKTGLKKMGKEEMASVKRKNRLATLSALLTIFFVLVFIYYGVSFLRISFYVMVCISMGLGNIFNFISNKRIYGEKQYHEGLLWVGLVLVVSAPIIFLLPSNLSVFFTAFVFLGSYTAISFRIYTDAETLLRESVTGDLGKLLSSESKLSSPVRLGIMILLRTKSKMIFSEIQKALRLTSGNLDSHLKHLEKSGYVHIKKGLSLKGPRTIIEITSEGEEELQRYVSKLKLAFSYEEMKK